jgi:hypothetical protein
VAHRIELEYILDIDEDQEYFAKKRFLMSHGT